MNKIVIITGCGRSGTLYMSKVMQCLGYKVGHEGLLADGISSWYIVDLDTYSKMMEDIAKDPRNHSRQFYYIHLLRNPLQVIKSMYLCEMTSKRQALDFARSVIPQFEGREKNLSFVADWWVAWNYQAEYIYPFHAQIKVENISKPNHIRAFAHSLGIKNQTFIDEAIKNIKALGEKVHSIEETKYFDLDNSRYKNLILNGITLDDIRLENEQIADRLRKAALKYGYEI